MSQTVHIGQLIFVCGELKNIVTSKRTVEIREIYLPIFKSPLVVGTSLRYDFSILSVPCVVAKVVVVVTTFSSTIPETYPSRLIRNDEKVRIFKKQRSFAYKRRDLNFFQT